MQTGNSTLYWHDYETSGANPRQDRPVQFAGLRTDEALNEIGDPLVVYCKPARDRLPHPEACLLTGITPQMAEARGLPEPEFIALIHVQLAQPGTCGVGYNTLRFDDEVTRFTLYRNFYDPYAREWQSGNSRWDVIDLARMTFALRPEGIIWPQNDEGKPSFRLEDITAANGLTHDSAHDALSDVRATIALARLLRDQQPRLYDWLFRLRDKRAAASLLDLKMHTPVLHTSRMYSSEYGCTTLVMPLLPETGNPNSILVYDLRHDPAEFMQLDVDALAERLFTPKEELAEGQQRLPIKAIRLNKCPALAPQKVLNDEIAKRISLNTEQCHTYWQLLLQNPDFMQRIQQAYSNGKIFPENDADLALYDGFASDHDRNLFPLVRDAKPEKLIDLSEKFQDGRYTELLFRYRACNFYDTLSAQEKYRWQAHCRRWLGEDAINGNLTLNAYHQKLLQLRTDCTQQAQQEILTELEAWGRMLAQENDLPWPPD
ncbi:exodeoxyribonuclease I [Nitrosomonas sp.]|uniref:exodeoxyribonuclease I n=1 Tax=Nitrosomonas sp. TaxID=42353 RepID=UPI0033056ED2